MKEDPLEKSQHAVAFSSESLPDVFEIDGFLDKRLIPKTTSKDSSTHQKLVDLSRLVAVKNERKINVLTSFSSAVDVRNEIESVYLSVFSSRLQRERGKIKAREAEDVKARKNAQAQFTDEFLEGEVCFFG